VLDYYVYLCGDVMHLWFYLVISSDVCNLVLIHYWYTILSYGYTHFVKLYN
jgi:hypothetical protein